MVPPKAVYGTSVCLCNEVCTTVTPQILMEPSPVPQALLDASDTALNRVTSLYPLGAFLLLERQAISI